MRNAGLLIVIIALLAFAHVRERVTQAHPADVPTASAGFKTDEPVAPDAPIEIVLAGAETATIAVTIGDADVTAFFKRVENRLVYDAQILPLPSGAVDVKVFLVGDANNWKEIGRFTMTVAEVTKPDEPKPADAATETPKTDSTTAEVTEEAEKKNKFAFLPSFTIGMKSLPFQSNFPADTRPAERATFNDFTLSGSLKTEAKAGNFGSETNFDFAGSTFKPETPQFGSLGREAPDVDLTSYLMNFQIGKSKLAFGHTSFGNNRHLVSSFSSRGLSMTVPIGKRFDVTAGFLNGTSVIGFSNFSGLGKIRHQVQGVTLGIEFVPTRANALRLEVTGFNGYLQALNGVSEGRIVDAERSRGFGLRLVASDKSERLKVETGYTLSRFFNPQDTTLDPDGNAVALPPAVRGAHYAEVSFQFLKDLRITKAKNLNATATVKYEFVEPLFKSLGASASADRFSNDYTLDASLGDITFAYGHARGNDNVRNVPSILKSLTRTNRFNVALPTSALFGGEKPSKLLPRLGYSIDRTRQTAAGIPVNGGFEVDIATIPDLVNTNQSFSSAWDFGKATLEYTYSRSLADNRQTGSETLDQLGWTHGATIGLSPRETLSFTTGLTFETSKDLGQSTTNRTKSLNFGVNWTPFKGATLTSDLSQTLAGDAARTIANRGVNYNAQFSYTFAREKSRFDKFGAQIFVRFADTYSRNSDFLAISTARTRTKIVTTGITFNIF